MNLGFYLKKIRQEKKITLTEVAEKTDLTASLLSQIENEKSLPSLSSLEVLLKYYKVNLSDFFKQVEQSDFILTKKNEIEELRYEEMGLNISLLASKLTNNALESYLVELNPGSEINIQGNDNTSNGERFMYVLNGEPEIHIQNQVFRVITSESLNFKSYVSALIVNNSQTKAKLLINGTPPIQFIDKKRTKELNKRII
jgi:transcriptional regulator with XRE-family HTH domain